jgi:hypothetical protein
VLAEHIRYLEDTDTRDRDPGAPAEGADTRSGYAVKGQARIGFGWCHRGHGQ